MVETSPLPPQRQDDPRFPQAPTPLKPGEVQVAPPVRIPPERTPEEKDPREVAADMDAQKTVLEATGRIKRRKKPEFPPQADAGQPKNS